MRRRVLSGLALLFVCSPAFAQQARGTPRSPPGPRRPRVAVFDLQSVQGVSAGNTAMLSEIVSSTVTGLRQFEVITRRDIVALLGLEQQRRMFGCSEDGGCLAEIGGALGADYVLHGTVGQLGSRYRLSFSLLDVKKARALARQSTSCEKSEDALAEATQRSVRELFDEASRTGSVSGLAPLSTTAQVAPTSPRRTWGLAAGGTGLALVAAGAAFDILAYGAYQDEKTAAAAGDLSGLESAKSRSKSRGRIANVLYVVGAVGVGTGAILYFTGRPPSTSVSVAPVEGGAVAVLSGSLP